MSRDWFVCALCSQHFIVDYDADPFDVCPRCDNRISRISAREHARIASEITKAAELIGGPAHAAMLAVAKAVKGETT